MAPQVAADLPDDYRDHQIQGSYAPTAWWQVFEDPVLNEVVEEALQDNLDILEAAARLARTNAQARQARASLFPGLNGSGGASYSNSPTAGSGFGASGGQQSGNLDDPQTGDNGGDQATNGTSDRLEIQTYSTSLGASYELDLFGRVRNDFLAAVADAKAAEFDYHAIQLASAAEAIRAYFEIVDARRQIQLTLLTGDLLAERAEQTEERFARGLAQSFEVYQIRQDLRNTQASLPTRESQLQQIETRLALQLRETPGEIRAKLDRSLRPRLNFDPVPTGLPIDILAQRPDVAAAWERLEGARLRIGARKAERFPRLSFSGSLGTQSDSPGGVLDIADKWLASLAANLTAPIFDAGRISAGIASARATYDERAAIYARTVLRAHGEVVSALEDYEEQRQRYLLIYSQLEEAQASLDIQSRRFASGVGTYVSFLDAQRAVFQIEASLSAAARDAALARLGVHRALGGDWTLNDDVRSLEMRPLTVPAQVEDSE